jgi:hypothetical protein
VVQYRVSGKPAHDARLVAAMKVHGLTSILTFDSTGFSRYTALKLCIRWTQALESRLSLPRDWSRA